MSPIGASGAIDARDPDGQNRGMFPARLPLPALLASLAIAAGCATPPDPATATAAPDGARVFQRHCSACHGEKGDAKSLTSGVLSVRPRDFTTPEASATLTREYMIAIARDGRPHTPMTGKQERLSQEEIEAAVDHIRRAFMKQAPGAR